MIPSTTNQLLVTEDWKKIYQSYRNADFQSYDFETIRRTMIQYLQENYPEDFNDYIDSSEYIALIDLIAYLGQNLSFRIDLNARENFLETASRRDSILRLAQLISYAPSRNIPSSGFLKITAISTTDSVLDSNNINLANTTVVWNDATNSNWYQQFISIINNTMSGSFAFGNPYSRDTISGILTEQYRINSTNTDVPVFSFSKSVNGINMSFEVVSSSFSGSTSIYEEAPTPANTFALIYQNDNQGYSSSNTGFFAQFRQGSLGISSFSITSPVPNEIVGVNTSNINDTDVWLWQLDANGNYTTLWTKVPSVIGNNVIYNSLSQSERNIYSTTTRDQDQIDINFADGSFGNLPKGDFRLIYRQSNALTYSITPDQMSGVVVKIPYTNKSGQSQTLTLTMGLQYTVSNSAGPESNASIQLKAPQAYYTQNRMVTAEDYNIAPLTLGNDILKVKSVNRVSSGISKYFELSDVSGKYSKTNIFAEDGIVYKNNSEENFYFTFVSQSDIFNVIKQKLEPVVASTGLFSFYLDQYQRPDLSYLNLSWVQVNKLSGQSRGYFKSGTYPQSVGSYASSNLSYVTAGSLIKFVPPAGYYFDKNNLIQSIPGSGQLPLGAQNYIWAKVLQVIGTGDNSGVGALDDGTGPIILDGIIDNLAIPVSIIPKFITSYSYTFESELASLCSLQRNFGLSFNQISRTWNIILDTNLNLTNGFSLSSQGDVTSLGLDASWLIAFVWTGTGYTVRYRLLNYVFESVQETAFYVDPNSINYDYTSGSVIKDKIDVLSFNTTNTSTHYQLGKDYSWQIDSTIVEPDGYVDPTKVQVSFYDYNSAGSIQDPDTFNNIVQPDYVNPNIGYLTNFVYFQKASDGIRYQLSTATITAYSTPLDVITPVDGELYYFYDSDFNVVNSYSASTDSWIYQPDYFAYFGRSDLKFHYIHNSGEDRRIDPSKSNIIDVYMLTSTYDTAYRAWLSTSIGTEPVVPTSQSLELNYSAALTDIKTISDEIVFQPVKYKILFGSQANINLQATFKAVKNPNIPTSDNDLKTQILNAINQFFALENWDFGQTFNFSELSTYVMNLLTPNITNFVIVPKINNFGSLYQITCASNEIFISGATVNDISIIDAITATQLNTVTIITNSGS